MSESTERQEVVDRLYWTSGTPCCAGCDWWRHLNSLVGECLKSAPVGQHERWAMAGIEWTSLQPGAGHVVTTRDHVCGDFKDTFDWTSLPPAYLRRIGYREGMKA